MPILDTLPPELERALTVDGEASAAAGVVSSEAAPGMPDRETANGHPHTVFATDVTALGHYGTEWLVLRNGRLQVFEPGDSGSVRLRSDLTIDQVLEARAEPLIGNGILRVRTADGHIDLVRYSQATAGEANMVARRVNALVRQQEIRYDRVERRVRHCPKCKRVLPDDSDVCRSCINRRAVMLRLFRFLQPYRGHATASGFVILSTSIAELAPPWIAGRIVDTVVNSVNTGSRDLMPILYFVLMFAGTRVWVAGMMYCQRRLSAFLGARTLMDIRVAMFDRLNQLSLGYYDKRTVGSVMSRITNDADHLWDFLTDGIPWFLSTVLAIVGTSLVLFGMNWRLAAMLLTPGILVFLLNRWFMPRARRRWKNVWLRISRMYSALGTTLNGMRVVKAFAQEPRESGRFRERNLQVFRASYAANSMWAVYWPALGLVMSCGYYIVWLYGGHSVLTGAMTVGTLTAFAGYLVRFYQPFQEFSRVIDWSTRSLTAAERVFEVLDTEPEIRDAETVVHMPDMRGEVEFDNVSFTYDRSRLVLDSFCLKVAAGEMIGLVGHSGAGKTTVVNLLSRFYDVTEGCIRVDGADIRDINQADFRRQFGIVLQEPFLFPGTIRDNIAYANPEASTEEVMRASKAANAHEFILKFADGYDTPVGERGQRLSGGERQRISIARAILRDPKILILDEATASVDTETEQLIQQAIQRLVKNRTTFAIAHRLSTLRNADRLVVMKDGKMAECGTHDELVEQDGVYAGLVRVQTEVNRIRAI
ncbi:MAG TPA: ABC transporter ATP-binding protein [Chthonomonadales bacterium]|nr:ABC transporter ATP-binding protein [Chthonomonadales bacterium]